MKNVILTRGYVDAIRICTTAYLIGIAYARHIAIGGRALRAKRISAITFFPLTKKKHTEHL